MCWSALGVKLIFNIFSFSRVMNIVSFIHSVWVCVVPQWRYLLQSQLIGSMTLLSNGLVIFDCRLGRNWSRRAGCYWPATSACMLLKFSLAEVFARHTSASCVKFIAPSSHTLILIHFYYFIYIPFGILFLVFFPEPHFQPEGIRSV